MAELRRNMSVSRVSHSFTRSGFKISWRVVFALRHDQLRSHEVVAMHVNYVTGVQVFKMGSQQNMTLTTARTNSTCGALVSMFNPCTFIKLNYRGWLREISPFRQCYICLKVVFYYSHRIRESN